MQAVLQQELLVQPAILAKLLAQELPVVANVMSGSIQTVLPIFFARVAQSPRTLTWQVFRPASYVQLVESLSLAKYFEAQLMLPARSALLATTKICSASLRARSALQDALMQIRVLLRVVLIV